MTESQLKTLCEVIKRHHANDDKLAVNLIVNALTPTVAYRLSLLCGAEHEDAGKDYLLGYWFASDEMIFDWGYAAAGQDDQRGSPTSIHD